MSNPQYVKVKDKLYKINTDFRVALECEKIAKDSKIGDYERAMAIIYKLFGKDGLDCNDIPKLLELGIKYINVSSTNKKSLDNDLHKDFKLDITKCSGLIQSSFKFDYNYNPYELEYLHWYDFYNDLQNLSTSEFGNCCILNRIISILNQKPEHIKDNSERQNLINAQNLLKEKYCIYEEKRLTKEQEESAKAFYKSLGIEI